MVLEKVTDFKVYNEQVEKLKDEIEAFKISNPLEKQTEHEPESDEDEPLMTDITENDIPENYCKTNPQDDLALDSERLHESIAVEYSRLREVIASRAKPPVAVQTMTSTSKLNPLMKMVNRLNKADSDLKGLN